jgi:hypothetical protein
MVLVTIVIKWASDAGGNHIHEVQTCAKGSLVKGDLGASQHGGAGSLALQTLF